MSATLDDLYLEFLYSQVASVEETNPRKTYWSILRDMYTKEFIWFIPNDDNRVEDGRDLRDEFRLLLCDDHLDREWRLLGCSFLEMLIGLARRLSFEAGGEPSEWFWEMVTNLRIAEFDDHFYQGGSRSHDVVSHILDDVIWRTYKPNGFGGLFPLKNFSHDQRDVELWYQMNEYLLER